mgnify:CR=1 FL=1
MVPVSLYGGTARLRGRPCVLVTHTIAFPQLACYVSISPSSMCCRGDRRDHLLLYGDEMLFQMVRASCRYRVTASGL